MSPIPPPRDKNGEVLPHNHSQVADQDRVIRRISDQFIAPDEKSPSGKRISSMAFQPSTDGSKGMSVDLEAFMIADQIDPRRFVTTPRFMGSVFFSTGTLRGDGLLVGYEPIDGNPYHGGVWGSFTKGKQRKLLKSSQWYVKIDGVDLS